MKKTATLNLIGNAKVGKSHIAQALTGSMFSEETNRLREGGGYNVSTKKVDGNEVRLRIWSNSGDPNFIHITRQNGPQYGIIVFVYDITDQKSFDDLAKWMSDFENILPAGCAKVVVGNKLDLHANRVVSTKEAKKFSQENGATHIEVSARNGLYINQFIDVALKQAGQEIKREKFENVLSSFLIELNKLKKDGKSTSSGPYKKILSDLDNHIIKAKADSELLADPTYAQKIVDFFKSSDPDLIDKELKAYVIDKIFTNNLVSQVPETTRSTNPIKNIGRAIKIKSVEALTKNIEKLIKGQKEGYLEEVKSLISKENRPEVLRAVFKFLSNSNRSGNDYIVVADVVKDRLSNLLRNQGQSKSLPQYMRDSVPKLNAEKQEKAKEKSDRKGIGKSSS